MVSFAKEKLENLKQELQGEITRDRALIQCGDAFGSEYCKDLHWWYFEDGKFDKDALLNHVECQLDAIDWASTQSQAKSGLKKLVAALLKHKPGS